MNTPVKHVLPIQSVQVNKTKINIISIKIYKNIGCSTSENRRDSTSCACSDNFYDTDTECLDCVYPCQTCTSPIACTLCKGIMTNRTPGTCKCEVGYYDKEESSTHTCTLCRERYFDCSAEDVPISCKGNNRQSVDNDCIC